MDERLHRIIREAELTQYCGLKRTQILQLIAEGKFPRPVKLSARRKGWVEDELIRWQSDKIRSRDATRVE